jgi:hypothetical protein
MIRVPYPAHWLLLWHPITPSPCPHYCESMHTTVVSNPIFWNICKHKYINVVSMVERTMQQMWMVNPNRNYIAIYLKNKWKGQTFFFCNCWSLVHMYVCFMFECIRVCRIPYSAHWLLLWHPITPSPYQDCSYKLHKVEVYRHPVYWKFTNVDHDSWKKSVKI